MVAMSANPWITRRSSSPRTACSVLKALIVPMTVSLSRMGNACTALKPADSAAGANTGHRSCAPARSALTTGSPADEALQARTLVSLELQQVEHLARLVGGRHEAQLAAMVGQHQADGVRVADDGDVLRQALEEQDEVEVVHQGVRHFDEQVRQVRG